jgi:hypothetical protein
MTDAARALIWWRSLSINEMKAFEEKYYPRLPWYLVRGDAVTRIWIEEGRP